jgi:hypothetical protein
MVQCGNTSAFFDFAHTGTLAHDHIKDPESSFAETPQKPAINGQNVHRQLDVDGRLSHIGAQP